MRNTSIYMIYRLGLPDTVFRTAPTDTRNSSKEERVFISAAGKNDDALLKRVAKESGKRNAGPAFSPTLSGSSSFKN